MLAELSETEIDYPGRGRALGPFSLTVRAGEIVAIVGASGCGKSTALRVLAGLETPSRGTVRRTVSRGETSLVFQSPTLMPWAIARANVALPLRLAGRGAKDADGAARAMLARVGLAGAADAFPAQLSGGMAMRVALARALVTGPRLLLLDEPFAALDSVTRRSLMADAHRLWAQSLPGVVFVTHDVEDAAFFASRIVVMSRPPGRAGAEILVDGDLPRPGGFRTDPAFRHSVERVAAALEREMETAP